MKLIQLGGANDALCHFLSFGGYEILLDCGVSFVVSDDLNVTAPTLRIFLPALAAVDVASLDVVLVSNHLSILALPFLTQHLGFKGVVYATEMTMAFGRVLMQELSKAARHHSIVVELPPTVTTSSSASAKILPVYSTRDIAQCYELIRCVEYNEVTRLSYGVSVTALSSGFSLGSSMWLLESPNDRLGYVAAASGDLNRHPKELDFAPLMECDTLVVTDIKPERDPHATTDRTVEQLLAAINCVTDRGGVCILPVSLAGMFFDLVEAIYVACIANKPQPVPLLLLSPFADQTLDLTQCGAEFLCEKKAEKLYTGEPAFAHELLRQSKVLQVVPEITSQIVSTLQHGGVVFVSHPSLRLGLSSELVKLFGHDSRHAVVLSDATLDPRQVLAPFFSLEIEKMVCPIDARLSCGDVNQFIARCCPRNLIVPQEFLVDSSPLVKAEQIVQEVSHFSKVFPLQELIAARPKTEHETFAMKPLHPISIEKGNKYIDGKLDPDFAAQTMMTEVHGKGVACVSGRITVRQREFVVESAKPSTLIARGFPIAAHTPTAQDSKMDGKTRVVGAKRKAVSMTGPPSLSPSGAAKSSLVVKYRERSSMLLGQVDEEKLLQQLKAHDPHLDVYISQGPNNADSMVSIPALDARVTLWKETSKTLIETPKEEARVLLKSMVVLQLHELPM